LAACTGSKHTAGHTCRSVTGTLRISVQHDETY
jgi:hypothetical protein